MRVTPIELMRVRVGDRLERLPICGYHRCLFAVIAMAFFFDNLDLAMMTYLLGSIRTEFGLTSAQAGMLGSASFVGMAVGALGSGMLADRFGRKPVFQVSMIVWGVGSFLCSTANDPVTLGLYRLLLGIGMGMELPLAQTLLSEFIPARQRGKYLALMDGNWPIAFICAGLMSYYVLSAYDWRTMFMLGAVPALFLFVVRRYVPESPRWLESKGRHEEAARIVDGIESTVMRRLKLTSLPEATATVTTADAQTFGVKVLWSAEYRNRTMTVWGLWFFALLGFYGLNTWIGALLQQGGMGVTKSVLYTVYISIGGIPGFLFAAWAVERWGRKPACVATLVGGAVAAFLYGRVAGMHADPAALFLSGGMMQFFMFGMWAVLYTYTPELYPTRARATGCGMASTVGRVGSLIGPSLVGLVLPLAGQSGVFALGAASFLAAAWIVYRFGIETRGEALESISAS
ncbi:MFS transporter [Cupriavidus gilardii]|uniref:MFS transporter n=1 Tax=Cupriavidus gilardii TaxID=82541 RepID=A0A849B993_9BURK|nr:MFS transporter [Cupriavidus gilardii]KAB0599463.1 MFS transporter [Cupriavidus gilardii]MCT9013037.1 MFS transporter [Cupriavidus gilardii]MCT9052591.1 MFS transporter [Cupriavidus gilardii]NNH10714.1 MFS transporter [Cupriavidus gilardii]WNG68069.1 MFS transporter [Cupriavidus gilardii]